MKERVLNLICIILAGIWAISILYVFYLIKVKGESLCYSYKGGSLIEQTPKIFPVSHWRDKVASACVNCAHTSFITKHWDKDRLYCENCKILHRGKMTKHYMYDAVITCKKCGHERLLTVSHENYKINCTKCKMEHYAYYSNNVIN